MKTRRRIFIGLLLFISCGTVVWFTIVPKDPLFRGKPESEWIANLSYGDDEQVQRWRDFGPEGVHVLVRALDGANRPADRFYRRVHRFFAGKMPAALMDRLPVPRMDLTRTTRMNVVALLARLSKDAKEATPTMARALGDENPSVRQLAITFFTAGEDENCLLNQMPPAAKKRLLPDFVRLMQDSSPGVRNNTAIALRYYPEEAKVVVPILRDALKDPVPKVQKLAADALRMIDPAALEKAESPQ